MTMYYSPNTLEFLHAQFYKNIYSDYQYLYQIYKSFYINYNLEIAP